MNPWENEIRYRLSNEHEILGYSRWMDVGFYYSKDGYAWNGKVIPSQFQDRFSGYFDKSKKPLFSNDLIIHSFYPSIPLLLHFDSTLDTFQLIEWESQTIFDMDICTFFGMNGNIVWKGTLFHASKL
jgi:hypothetical protein